MGLLDKWTIEDCLRALHFQIEDYNIFKESNNKRLADFNLEAIGLECERVVEIIHETRRKEQVNAIKVNEKDI